MLTIELLRKMLKESPEGFKLYRINQETALGWTKELLIKYIGDEYIFAVDLDKEENTYEYDDILNKFSCMPPVIAEEKPEEDIEEKIYELDDDFNFYLSEAGSLSFCLKGSATDAAMISNVSYKKVDIQ